MSTPNEGLTQTLDRLQAGHPEIESIEVLGMAEEPNRGQGDGRPDEDRLEPEPQAATPVTSTEEDDGRRLLYVVGRVSHPKELRVLAFNHGEGYDLLRLGRNYGLKTKQRTPTRMNAKIIPVTAKKPLRSAKDGVMAFGVEDLADSRTPLAPGALERFGQAFLAIRAEGIPPSYPRKR